MSKPINGTQIKAQFKKWNVSAEYLSGFETRGRPASTAGGPFVDVKGIIIHHTASESQTTAYVDWLFKTGRADLPAPLCQFATNKQGLTYVGALGKANHAGMGSQNVLNLVKSEDYDAFNIELKGGNTVNGNPWFYGNEVMFGGVNGQAMTQKQYDGVVRFAAALCDFHGWSAKSVIGHREWANTKIDPSYVKMYKLRQDVQALLDAGPSGTPTTTIPPVVVSPEPTIIDKMDPKSYPPNGYATGEHITWLGERLVIHGYTGYKVGPSDTWGPADLAGVKWFQEKQGWTGSDADGYPGSESLKRLAAEPVVVKTPADWFKLMTWNISNNNKYGMKIWGTRRSKVVSTIKSEAPDVFCSQENTKVVGKSAGYTYIDSNLTGYKRVAGGDGRYIYIKTKTVKFVAGGVFDLQPRYKSDDKQAAWAVLRINGSLALITSYHLENEGTSDSTRIAQLESCHRQAKAKAKQYKVGESQIFHAGDTNFRTEAAITAFKKSSGMVDMFDTAVVQVDKAYKSLNSWINSLRGFRIDRGWASKNRPVKKADQRRSLFATADHNAQLYWIGRI